ncbi:MAG: hypothetical protein E7354_05270 [Clostridiales bacterium]|nr:hypothetical protein [Clostridiales bacterium]
MSYYGVSGNNNTMQKFVEQLRKNGFKYEEYSEKLPPKIVVDDFEILESHDTEIGGSSIKFFARLDDSKKGFSNYPTQRKMCDSKYFKTLFYQLTHNPNCSYQTIYNDLIKNEKYFPRYISVLIKDCHNNRNRVKGEIFGSRAANILRIPTNYCAGLKDTVHPSLIFSDTIGQDYFAVASVDYLHPGQTIESFSDMKYEQRCFSAEHSLETWLAYADRCLQARYPDGIDEESYKQFQRDFVKTYLFRATLFPDTDFAIYNGGIISEANSNKFKMYPNTDMEGLLESMLYYGTKSYMRPIRRRARKAINYCRNQFPEVLDEFMCDLENGHKEGLFIKALEDLYVRNSQNKAIYDNVRDSIEAALHFYKHPTHQIIDSLIK